MEEPESQRLISFDGWVFRTPPRELMRAGKAVRLQDQPLQILEELLTHPNELVTREQLISRLWPTGVVEFDSSLNVAVRKLRVALGDDSETPKYIETVPRRGYRFVGEIEASPPATGLAVAPPAAELPTSSKSPRWLRFGGAALLLAAIAVAMLLPRSPPVASLASTTHVATRPRIGVLPFENLSPDPDVAFFTDGLHEEILSTLATRAPNLDVISRTTMMTYRGARKPVPAIAAELGLSHVLEGSVRREGRTLRLVLELVDARTDTQLWTRTYDRELVGTMTLQSEVAAEVASRLAVRLSAGGEQLPPSPDPQAFDLYLRARLASKPMGGRTSQSRILEVKRWLDDAVALDAAFAAAHVERARARLRLFDNSFDLSAANLAALRADLASARELAGEIPQVLMLESQYAQIVDWDMDRATRLLGRPEVLASRDVDVLMGRAALLATLHRPEDALAIYRRAAQLDPENEGLRESWIAVLWNDHRPSEALRVIRASSERAPRLAFDFAFTGHTEQLDEAVYPVNPDIDADSRLMARANRFRFRGMFGDSIAVLEHSDLKTMRQDSFSPVTIPAIGRKPVAELHGWAMLLSGNRAAAARDGRVLREFVASEPVTKWNAWFLRVLSAEAALFSGDNAHAIEGARAAMGMIPRNLNTAIDRYLPTTAAMILAWAGAGDEAMGLIEDVARHYPGVGPAEIAREPLFTVPLATNARFRALATELEQEIAENRALFDANSGGTGAAVRR